MSRLCIHLSEYLYITQLHDLQTQKKKSMESPGGTRQPTIFYESVWPLRWPSQKEANIEPPEFPKQKIVEHLQRDN